MKDILNRARVLRALVALRKADPEPLTAAQLQAALECSVVPAAEARRDLASWGLITVDEGFRKKVPYVEMRLTEGGRVVADLAIKLAAAAEKTRDVKKRD